MFIDQIQFILKYQQYYKELEKLTTINPSLVLQNKRIEKKEPNNIELTWKEKLILKLKR